MDTGSYQFTDLKQHENLIHEITQLENKLKTELGKEVTLIAYSKDEQQS